MRPESTEEELEKLAKLIPLLDGEAKAEAMDILSALVEGRELMQCRERFIPFVKRVWPGFVAGKHHEKIAEAFEAIARGELKRVCISLPPRSTKSEFASYLFPAWYLGLYPDRQILQTSHKAELAVGFGRKLRNLVSSPSYAEVFDKLTLRADSKAAGRWQTVEGGTYYATGVGAGLAGFGANLCIIDDPHDEQEAMHGAHDPSIFAKAFDWYQTGPRQRLQPGGAILVIHTRWSKADLIGRLLRAQEEREGSDKWHVIEIPALDERGESYWPEYWPTEELVATKNNIPPIRWNAQYMQSPTNEQGALIKKEWWKRWEGPLPTPSFIIQSWDTAHRKTQRSDYSACTTWGVFESEDKKGIVLLDVWRGRLEFPELKKKALELHKKWKPDSCIVEGKAAGDALIFELRHMGLPIASYTPSRGEDKIVRVNAIADLFASGMVWAPETLPAEELIQEFSDFPLGHHDDMVDASTLALARFRQGRFIRLDSDEDEDDLADPAELDCAFY